MLVSNNWYSITCQSCCCTTYKVDLNKADFMSKKCLCKSTACSDDAHDLTEAAGAHENYQCPQLQYNTSDSRTRDVPCASVSSGTGRAQCTCRAELQLLSPSASVAHRSVCACQSVLKSSETLMHVVRYDQSVNDLSANHHCCRHCCTCIGNCSQDPAMSNCQWSVALSDSTSSASVCPGCTKLAQVNRPEQADSCLTSRQSEQYGSEKEQKKAVSICRPGQLDSVIMDVNEWQRRHIEQLQRQKLEVVSCCIYTVTRKNIPDFFSYNSRKH